MNDRPQLSENAPGAIRFAVNRNRGSLPARLLEERKFGRMETGVLVSGTRSNLRRGGSGGAVVWEVFSMFSQRAVPSSGGAGRGSTSIRSNALAKRLAVVAIALAGLSLGGCAQFGRVGCGTCGNGLFQGHLKRLFNHKRGIIVTEGCEPGLAGPCDVMPGAIVPGPVIQAPAVEEVPALEPAPSSVVPSTSSATPTKRTLYETLKPNGGTTTSRRSGDASSFATPESASRPAQAVADSSLSGDPLVNLPPVSATIDRSTEELDTPPLPPPADEVQAAAPIKPEATPDAPLTTAAPAPDEIRELPVKPVAVPVSVAPGFKRFKVVDRQLAAGTVPTEAGWEFLLEKGYKTVIDLRETGEVQAGDVALAARSGFRYIPLPVTPQTLNAATLAKFQEEITLAGSRPLLFFDDNGARPAVMWYLKQVSIDKIDPADAARDAEEIGPKETKYWLAAASLLEGAKVPGVAPPAADDSTISVPSPAPGPDAPLPTLPEASSADGEYPVARVTPDSAPVTDPTGWKPYAALMVAGFGLPVAYVSRGVLSYRPFAKASLPAPSRARKAIASSSDV